MSDRCPKCGADEMDFQRHANLKVFKCGSGMIACVGGWKFDANLSQSDACRIRELTAENARLSAALAELLDATKDVHHLLTGYHPGYIGLNADGNVLFTQYDVACAGHNLGEARTKAAALTPTPIEHDGGTE